MAKQNTTASSTVLSASAALAQSQVPADLAGEFMKTFGAATAEFEKERKAVQNEVKGWLSNLKTDIDFTSMPPAMEQQVRNALTAGKNEYSDLANKVARIKDTSSMEYKNAVDRMNEIQREFQILAKEVGAYNQDKVNVALGIEKDLYSMDEDLSLYRDIYGLKDGGVAGVTVNGGHLVFNVNGKEVRYDNLQGPLAASQLPAEIAKTAIAYNDYTREMNTREENYERVELAKAFKDDRAFGAFLLDTPAELEEIKLQSIMDEYVTAKKDGTLPDKIEDLKKQAIDMIIQGYKDAALDGKIRADIASEQGKEGDKKGKFSNLSADSLVTLGYYRAGKATIPAKGGEWAVAFDKDGEPMVKGGIPNKDFTPPVSFYEVGQYDNDIWKANPNYERIPADNDAEAVRILGLK